MAKAARKRTTGRKRTTILPKPNEDDYSDSYPSISFGESRLDLTENHNIKVCEMKGWRDKHGIVVQFGDNDPLRIEDWRAGKGDKQVDDFLDGAFSDDDDDDLDVYIPDLDLRTEIEQAIRDTKEGTPERKAAFAAAIEKHVAWDEPLAAVDRDSLIKAAKEKALNAVELIAAFL